MTPELPTSPPQDSEGKSLADLVVERGKLPVEEFLPVFRSFCQALAEWHARGSVHGALQPSSVILREGGPCLLISKEQNPRAGETYAAPEVRAGGAETIVSDIYSLGAVCFEALTGSPPFSQLTWAAKRSGRPPQLGKAVGVAPMNFVRSIERCLEPEPKRRFQSVQDLMTASSQFLSAADPATSAALADVMPEEPPDIKDALPLFRRMAAEVHRLHELKIVHSVLTTYSFRIRTGGDVMLTPAPAGVSRDRQWKYAPGELYQRGSMDPLPPEEPSSDVYSLGFIFYEVLLGADLFAQELAPIIRQMDSQAWREWHGETERRLRPARELVPSTPEGLSTLIETMTLKWQHARPANLAEIVQALDGIERGEDTVSLPAPHPPLKLPWWRDQRMRIAAAGAIFALALVVGYIGRRFYGGDSSQPVNAGPSATPSVPHTIETTTGAMALVPEGVFTMGRDSTAANEAPAHQVRLPAFYIDKYEVTNGWYRKFASATNRALPAVPSFDRYYFDRADYPVLNVSWEDASAFAAWAGKRLPSEAEWEKAARGNDGRRFPWGSHFREAAANLRPAGRKAPAPVGWFAFDFSPYGVLDMAGNVSEWVGSDYGLYQGNPSAMDSAEAGGKVVRGGTFDSHPDEATTSRRSARPATLAGKADSPVGFRCAADPATALKLRR